MSGKHRWVVWALVAAVLWLGGMPVQAAERRIALVIGNAQYQHGGAMPAAGANAGTVADALRRAGFEVTTANNLEHRGLVAALSRFQQALAGAELGLVYYSGLTLGLGGKSYVVPVNAKLASEYDVIFDTIELDFLLQQAQGAGRGAVVVVDPVVPNPLADRLAAAMGPAGRSVSAAPGTPPTLDRMLVVYSQRPGTAPVPSRGGAAGPFAASLAQEIVRPGAELRDALAVVEREVAERTRGAQRPWMQDRLGGAVQLVPALAAAAPPPPAQTPPQQQPPAPPRVAEPEVEPLADTYVVTRDTNLRQGPDVRTPVLRTLRRDSTVAVTGRIKGGAWLRVETEGQTGFAYAPNLGRSGRREAMPEPAADLAARPPAMAEAGPDAVTPGPHIVVRTVTLFAQPTLGARGVRELEAGAPVTVLDAIPGTNWVHVRDRFARDGYVSAGALAPEKGAPQARRPEVRAAERAPEPMPEVPLAGSGSSVAAL
ncbi:MAG TPA: caspase family protein, partial [Azospirillum sp.]